MSTFISSLITGINSDSLWSIASPIVPFVVIIFGVAFGVNLLSGWVEHNSIINDPDCLGYYDKHGKYHHLRDPEYYE